MTDHNKLIGIAAKNYVLSIAERSRAADQFGDFADQPTLSAAEIKRAYDELMAETANVTVAFQWNRRLPAIQEDGHIHYPRTEDMDLDYVNAALITIATEQAWLARAQVQRADEFATLLKIRSRLQSAED
ncbi:hypothetical protein [Kitasatospora acidiphila]|uniref:hypothetical protein n=1 Tax=Kitasatospora acidiphila TaxID=2567942 RepID=UPI003C7163DB